MIKHLKQFTSDSDRQDFEGSQSYERPYIASVNGTAHFNKLITGTIENPAVGEVNVQNGDYFDIISLPRSINIGKSRSNILCFPFNITINELREAFYPYRVGNVKFASDYICNFKVDSQGIITRESWNADNLHSIDNYQKKDGTLIIPAGKPFFVEVNIADEYQKIAMTLTFRNKTIVIQNSLVQENIPQSNWYLVGTPFKIKSDATQLSTASNVIGISNGIIVRANLGASIASFAGWLEYRGPVPSE